MNNSHILVFLASSLSQPRIIRRIETIYSFGYRIWVYGYDRGQYNCNKLSCTIPVAILGQMSKGGDYFDKLRQIRKDVKHVVRKHGRKECLYYSFGILETLFLFLSRTSYIYEISDIAYSGHRYHFLIRMLDRLLIKKSVFTVMTSPGFGRYINIGSSNIIILPNKVNPRLKGCHRDILNKTENKFVFSFVGSIRYAPVLRFAKVIGDTFPQHQFHFYGVPNLPDTARKVYDLVNSYPNVKFFGEFKNPDDFEKIYSRVDVVVTTYGLTLNETILDANKLYEGILFCRPLIVTQNTFMSEQVERYKCGFAIDSSSEESIREFVASLTKEKVNEISTNERAIPDDFAFDDTTELMRMLRKYDIIS